MACTRWGLIALLASTATSSSALPQTEPRSSTQLGSDQFQKSSTDQKSPAAVSQDGFNSCLLSKVMVGNDNLMLQLDTRSSDFWVYSNSTNVTSDTGSKHVYHPETGTLVQNAQFNTAGDDRSHYPSVSGRIYTDRVIINGKTASSQRIGVATTAETSGVLCAMDGVFGLGAAGFQKLDKNTPPSADNQTFLESLLESEKEKAFTIAFDEANKATLSIGPANTRKYKGSLNHVNVVDDSGLWKVPVKYGVPAPGHYRSGEHDRYDAIIDTGNDLMFLPERVVVDYYKSDNIKSAKIYDGAYIVDCDAKLPKMKLKIGLRSHHKHEDSAHEYDIPGTAMNARPLQDMPGKCLGAVQVAKGDAILGNIFLRNVYTIFDLNHGKPRVGFATLER